MKKHVLSFAILLMAAITIGVCSCKAWRTISTTSTYTLANDSVNNKKCYGSLVAYSNAVVYDNCVNRVNTNISNSSNVGGLCGYEISAGTYTNCRNEGIIMATSPVGAGVVVGGLVGYSRSSFTGCSNSAPVHVTNQNTANGIYVGGIAGQTNATSTAQAINCSNSGTIDVSFTQNSSNNYIGGLMGNFNRAMTGCSNTGAITTNATGGTVYIGGIVGNYSGSTATSLTNCFNRADITNCSTSVAYVGGLIGRMNPDVSGFAISNCYSLGDYKGNIAAGLVGFSKDGTYYNVNNCYYYGRLTGYTSSSQLGLCQGRFANVTNSYCPSTYYIITGSSTMGTLVDYTTISGGAALVNALNGGRGLNSGWWEWTVADGRVVLVRP